VGHENRPATTLYDIKKRAKGTVYPVRISDLSVFHNVMVESDQDNLIGEISILN
jgi:hypothetical protein